MVANFNPATAIAMNSSKPAIVESPEKTFQHQNDLPSLPVPQLEKTMAKYLESVRAVASPSQYETTCKIVKDFMTGEGKQLHQLLLQRASNHKNWLEEWWEDYAYLIPRYPLHPLVNFGGSSDSKDFPDASVFYMDQANVMANHMHHLLAEWLSVRREKAVVMRSRGSVWCMNQTYRYMNACRIPQLDKDRIDHHFTLESEGPCPNHVVIMCRGHFWKLIPFDSQGGLLLPAKLEVALKEIKYLSKKAIPRVSTLSSAERNHWAQARNYLESVSVENSRILKDIESSICVFSLTDELPKSITHIARTWVSADPGNIWADKCLSYMVHLNGTVSTSSDHSNIDAIITMQQSQAIFDHWKNYREQDDQVSSNAPAFFEEMKFKIDEQVLKDIEIAYTTCSQLTSDIEVNVWQFTDFTNELFRALHIYGDTVIQMALQLGYFRLHNKPAPTYETAATRKFYHGRTETVRSCSPAAVEWAMSMLDATSTDKEREDNFVIACGTHDKNMHECTEGRGCDRHLFGLKILAALNGFEEPELFKDPAWKMSGGDGNFILSTSFIGYSDIFGGVAPMVKEGYGCFYKMNNDKITIFMSSYRSCPETSAFKLEESVRWALNALRPYLHAYSLRSHPKKYATKRSKL